jgi:hypothetical protein
MTIWRMRNARWVPKATTHPQNIQFSLFFHGTNSCTNALRCSLQNCIYKAMTNQPTGRNMSHEHMKSVRVLQNTSMENLNLCNIMLVSFYRWWQHASPKSWYFYSSLYGVIFQKLYLQYDIPWRASIFGVFGIPRQIAPNGRITRWTGSDLELSCHEVIEVLSRNLPDDIKKVKVHFILEQAAMAQG